MCLAETSIQAEPGCGLELLLGVDGCQRSIRTVAFGWIHILALRRVVADQTKELVVLLGETVEAGSQIVPAFDPGKRGLPALVFRAAGFGFGSVGILRGGLVICGVGCGKRGGGLHEAAHGGCFPRESYERVAFLG